MRLPSVRLPSMPLPSDWVEGLLNRGTLLYVLYTVLLFGVFMLVNFPYHTIVQRAIKALDLESRGLHLEHADTRFAWWRGLELERVRLAPTDPEKPAILEVPSLFVRPGIDGLVRGKLNSVELLGLMYGGAIDAHLAAGEGLQRATVSFEDLQLQRYPGALALLQLQEGLLGGKVSGVISIEKHGADDGETRAAAEVDLDHLSLVDAKYNTISLPPLHFDKAAIKLNLQNGRLEVQEFDADGPDLKVALSGQITLREPVQESVLNLKLSAVPGENSSDEMKGVLMLLPPPPKGAKPDTPRTISGTLAHPRVR